MSDNLVLQQQKPSLLERASQFLRGSLDRVVLALLVGMALVLLFDRDQLVVSLIFLADAVVSMAPYFLLAVVFAAYAKASSMDGLVVRAFGGNQVRSVLIAGLFGAVSPFCSCGVIPLIAAMLTAGVPLAPVMAFWIASPIMDPEMFILTTAGIGWNFAVAKTIAALGMGVFAGFAILGVQRMGYFGDPLQEALKTGSCCKPKFDADDRGEVAWAFWRSEDRRRVFLEECRATGWFLGKWLTLAFFLESLMVAYIAPEWIVSLVGEGNMFAIPLAALVGMPSYMNGYAAIPLVSGLLDSGMTSGAAMAFMTAGAVSSVPAAIAVFALVRRPVFAFYLALGLVGSVTSGLLFSMAA